jgi:ferredoxin
VHERGPAVHLKPKRGKRDCKLGCCGDGGACARIVEATSGEMKIKVDYDLCEGNALCMKVCPEVFEVRDDDRTHLLLENPGEELRTKVEAAVRRCPRQAISIVNE